MGHAVRPTRNAQGRLEFNVSCLSLQRCQLGFDSLLPIHRTVGRSEDAALGGPRHTNRPPSGQLLNPATVETYAH